MTEKELREIKRRFRPEKSNIPKIVGCFVNSNKEIVANISQSIEFSDSVVSEKLLAAMKRALSGSLGTNLTDIEFSTKDVTDSEEHRLLMQLRECRLQDNDILNSFYRRVIDALHFDTGYVILLANDIYDVFSRGNDGEAAESSERFSYIVCAICPVKNAPEALTFREADSLFHTESSSCLLTSAEVGFMFPAFDDRRTNIYGALYYTRSTSESYTDFTEAVFGKEAPMPPKLQRATFNEALADTLADECSFDVVRAVHRELGELVDAHKESKNPEQLTITRATVESVLRGCGIGEEKVTALGDALDESFGINAPLSPKNIISTNKFELSTPNVTVKVTPEGKELVSTRIIDGVKYIMIRADEGVELNGINVKFDDFRKG